MEILLEREKVGMSCCSSKYTPFSSQAQAIPDAQLAPEIRDDGIESANRNVQKASSGMRSYGDKTIKDTRRGMWQGND